MRFIELMREFIADNEPSVLDAETLRERIRTGRPLAA